MFQKTLKENSDRNSEKNPIENRNSRETKNPKRNNFNGDHKAGGGKRK